MRITEINIKFDNDAVFSYTDPKGLDIGGILGALGISAEGIANSEAGTWQAALQSLLSIGIGLLMKRFGV